MYLGRAACDGPIDGSRVISSKFSRFLSPIKAEARFAGYITRDDCSAPVRGADPLRPKRAHAQRPADRADRRLDPRIWLHQPGADHEEDGIIAGHGRVLAAHSLGLDEVPCIVLAPLTPTQRRAYVLADNKPRARSASIS